MRTSPVEYPAVERLGRAVHRRLPRRRHQRGTRNCGTGTGGEPGRVGGPGLAARPVLRRRDVGRRRGAVGRRARHSLPRDHRYRLGSSRSLRPDGRLDRSRRALRAASLEDVGFRSGACGHPLHQQVRLGIGMLRCPLAPAPAGPPSQDRQQGHECPHEQRGVSLEDRIPGPLDPRNPVRHIVGCESREGDSGGLVDVHRAPTATGQGVVTYRGPVSLTPNRDRELRRPRYRVPTDDVRRGVLGDDSHAPVGQLVGSDRRPLGIRPHL